MLYCIDNKNICESINYFVSDSDGIEAQIMDVQSRIWSSEKMKEGTPTCNCNTTAFDNINPKSRGWCMLWDRTFVLSIQWNHSCCLKWDLVSPPSSGLLITLSTLLERCNHRHNKYPPHDWVIVTVYYFSNQYKHAGKKKEVIYNYGKGGNWPT